MSRAGLAEAEAQPSLAELRARHTKSVDKSHADNTKELYVKSLRAFTKWCGYHGLTPFPTTAEMLGLWAEAQVLQGLSPGSIKTRASAIRSLHKHPHLAGLPIPAEPYVQPSLVEVEKTVRAYSAELAIKRWKPNKAEAMLVADLRRIKEHMTPKGFFRKGIDLRDWAILTLGFAMGGRRSELACLNIDDIGLDPDDPDWLMVRLCLSKTDQEGNGEVVMIKRTPDGVVCAVRAMMAWLSWLRRHGVTSGPVFQTMSSGGDKLMTSGKAETAEALERRMSGKAISLRYSKRSMDAQIKGFGDRIKRFTGHSGRRGGASEAAAAGATHEQMCSHFRWAKGSRMAFEYVEEADKRANNPMAAVFDPTLRPGWHKGGGGQGGGALPVG